MLKIFLIPVILLFTAYSANRIIYFDPQPDAKYVSTCNAITIGFAEPIDLTINEIYSSVTIYSGKYYEPALITKVLDGSRIIIKPPVPFEPDKLITVKLTGKLLPLLPGAKELTYSFQTASRKKSRISRNALNDNTDLTGIGFNQSQSSLIPDLIVTVNNNPSPGNLFIAPWNNTTWLMLNDNNGHPVWSLQLLGFGGDFKKQPNGNMTYFRGENSTHYEIDKNYNTVKTYSCGNGYTADVHELKVLNSGHAYLMAYDTQIVNMGHIVEGGDTAANVIGLVIQELDNSGNVVFQWRSWDHFEITDATHENLLASTIDYVHGNAIEIDNDSNILISSRNMDEITKIDHSTGNIIWRMGGKNNQFTFIGDNIGFSHQHDIRRISNGNITLYDNGNYHTPQFSRAVEYRLNEISKTAELVWQYRRVPSVFGSWGGNVQRLSAGNTLIGWGGTAPTITEVTPAGVIVFEASFGAGIFTYRAFKFSDELTAEENESGNVPVKFGLGQNYPNPFNPTTTIIYDIVSAADVELIIHDITGSVVQSWKLGHKQPGNYSYLVDGSTYSSGVYFYTLKAGAFVSTRKMILLK